MTALLLLAGCLGTEDADEVIEDLEEIVEDTLEIVGCGDETALNYVANVTSTPTICVFMRNPWNPQLSISSLQSKMVQIWKH